jgi:hypothetical protein|tara:strand:- start:1663 stop:2181 length:519 start_codon:yes stop_codon:yes gene_type:complete
MNSWIETYTGLKIDPFNPDPSRICIEDIAHALSMICRFTGHCKYFYSVAQHSVLVAKRCPDEMKLTGLLHDASEAYINDISSPVKPGLMNYREIEEELWRAIAGKFGLPHPWVHPKVKEIDRRLCRTEARDLMYSKGEGWRGAVEPYPERIFTHKPEYAEEEFLLMYQHLGG